MSLSKDLTDQFKERMQQNHDDMDITFSIMVLGTNFWPLNPPDHQLAIPADILPTYERFSKYYPSCSSYSYLLVCKWTHSCCYSLAERFLTEPPEALQNWSPAVLAPFSWNYLGSYSRPEGLLFYPED